MMGFLLWIKNDKVQRMALWSMGSDDSFVYALGPRKSNLK